MLAFSVSLILLSAGVSSGPETLPAANPPCLLRIETSPKRAGIEFLSWDTEGGKRAHTNLLTQSGVVLRYRDAGNWHDFVVTRIGPTDSPQDDRYRLSRSDGKALIWTVRHKPGAAAFVLAREDTTEWTVQMRWMFDPRTTPTTVLPTRWNDDGRFTLPTVINAPDFGQMLLTCPEVPGLSGTFEGSRRPHAAAMTLEWTLGSSLTSLSLDLSAVVLPAPSGLKDRLLWQQARRGWFGALQATSAWGEQDHPHSAPPGMLGNNVCSDPASVSLWFYADQAMWTPQIAPGVSVLHLVRRTIDYWINRRTRPTGEVVGYWEYGGFLDANAGPLIAAWDYFEGSNDRDWLAKRIDRLEFIADYLARRDIDDDGMIEAVQSGNDGALVQPNRSCAWWDAINCGHKDAYTNAIIYRAFRCLADLEGRLDRSQQRDRYTKLADNLKRSYRNTLFNPATGWLAWWKSADGKLHDYAAPTVNGIAIEYGLVSPEEGRQILARLRSKMQEVGFTRFDLGVPCTLVPVRRADYLLPDAIGCPKREDGTDTLGQYMNGGTTAGQVLHFLAAHYVVGDAEPADRILRAMLERQQRGEFQNGVRDAAGKGIDWTDWAGHPSGYEGYLADSFRFLQAVLLREKPFRDRLYRPLSP